MTKSELNNFLKFEVFIYSSKNLFINMLRKLKQIYLSPSARAIYYIRKMQYYYTKNGKFNKFLTDYFHMKLVKNFSMCIAPSCKIGLGLKLPHPVGIVIGSAVNIGEMCSIYQNVTIGGANIGDAKNKQQPSVGNKVVLFSGCKVLGSIRVADGCIVGANSVLLKNAENGVYVGCPAKKVDKGV